ncbi:MAG: hypothetical protein ACPGYP_01225 [Solirubrobacterales bacterium]
MRKTSASGSNSHSGFINALAIAAIVASFLFLSVLKPNVALAVESTTYTIDRTLTETRGVHTNSGSVTATRSGALAACLAADVIPDLELLIEANPLGLENDYSLNVRSTSSVMGSSSGVNKIGVGVVVDGVLEARSTRYGTAQGGTLNLDTVNTELNIPELDVTTTHTVGIAVCTTYGTSLSTGNMTLEITGQKSTDVIAVTAVDDPVANSDNTGVEDNLARLAGLIAAAIASFPLTKAFLL